MGMVILFHCLVGSENGMGKIKWDSLFMILFLKRRIAILLVWGGMAIPSLEEIDPRKGVIIPFSNAMFGRKDGKWEERKVGGTDFPSTGRETFFPSCV